VTWAGFFGSVYYLLCVNGAPRIKFFTELKATAFDFGIIAGLGAFVLVFQVVGSLLTNRVQRRKMLWIIVCVLHRILILGMLVAPFLFVGARARIAWIIMVLFSHDVLAQISVPIWLSWMADPVPQQTMSRFWAARQRTITWANIGVMILMAYGFDHFEKSGHIIEGFVILASIGVIFGLADILMFLAVPEPPQQPLKETDWLPALTEPLRDRSFRPFLVFMGYWHFAIFTSAPFFGLFMIDNLGLSVWWVQMLGVAGALGVAVTSRYWGLLCDTYGYKPVLELCSIGKAFTPLMFALAPRWPAVSIPFLLLMMFLDGLLNSGVGLAMQGYMLRATPRKNRSMYIAATNFAAIGIMSAVAPVITGRLIDVLNKGFSFTAGPYHFTGYQWIFLISMLLRFAAVPLARRIYEHGSRPMDAVLDQMKSRNSFRVTRLVYKLHESSDESHRLALVGTISNLENPLATRELIHSLGDTNIGVREAAADALGRIGVAEAARPLSHALSDPGSGIQPPAARALGRIGGFDSLKALLENLRHQDAKTQTQIIDSLGELGDSAAIVPLICLFHDIEDPYLRKTIAVALGKLGETESLEEVMNVLQGRVPTGQFVSIRPREPASDR
jgi:MFS family permease